MDKNCPYCFLARVLVVAVIGIFLSWLMYTEWFTTTCAGRCDSIAGVLFMPAVKIGAIVGGGMQGMNEMHFAIGMIIELWILLAVGNRVISTVQRKKAHKKRIQPDPARPDR